jgi:hypothetical protein
MTNALLKARRSEPAVTSHRGRRWLIGCAVAASIALLYFAYLSLSRTYPENSDEANILLMAQDMLHGNPLLRHWYTSDVPFISTELPEISLLVGIFGLNLGTAHIAAALTYTLVICIAVLLARGPRRQVTGRAAVGRMAVAGGIMLGPQTGVGVFVLLLSVGHIGTAVPVMLTWLVVDRFGTRVWVPFAVTLMLAWGLIADPLVKVVAIWPLILVCLVRIGVWLIGAERDGSTLGERFKRAPRARWFEFSLIAAAIAGWWLASAASLAITDAGGYRQNPVPFSFAPASSWWAHARVSIDGLLYMFGANFIGQHGLDAVLAILHLVGLVLVLWGILATLRRAVRLSTSDLISEVLVVAIVANLVAYVPSTLAEHSALNAREFAMVLPFAAVVAGRQLGARFAVGKLAETSDGAQVGPRLKFLIPALSVVLAGYAWTVGIGAASPAAPAPYAQLIAWLKANHLTRGLGGYWQSSVITVGSGGAVTIRALTTLPVKLPDGSMTTCDIFPYKWEINTSWYVPAHNHADFILSDLNPKKSLIDPMGKFNLPGAALHALGDHNHYTTYWFGNAVLLPYPPHRATYMVRKYHYNLLTRIPLTLPERACQSS